MYKPPVKSPYQQPVYVPTEKDLVQKMVRDLVAMKKEFVAMVKQSTTELDQLRSELQQKIAEAEIELLRAKKIQKGDQGNPGETPVLGVHYTVEPGIDGTTPIKGVDYFDGEPGYTPQKGVDYFDGESPSPESIVPLVIEKLPKIEVPSEDAIVKKVLRNIKLPVVKNGENGKDADPKILIDAFTQLVKDKKIKITMGHIDGLDQEIRSIRNIAATKGQMRGGGDTVTAGSNITITTDVNGKRVITAAAGGITRLTATGAKNGVNLSFTFTEKPDFIISDGAWYEENIGWTWAGLTATMTIPPNDNIFGVT